VELSGHHEMSLIGKLSPVPRIVSIGVLNLRWYRLSDQSALQVRKTLGQRCEKRTRYTGPSCGW
jgi:hypothetical protein